MKKIFACITALGMMTAMTACGNDDPAVSKADKTTSAVTETKEKEASEKATEKATEEKKAPKASDEIAVKKMNDLFKIDSLLAGFAEYDENDSVQIGGIAYYKVTDKDKISSLSEFQTLIKNTCAGDLRNKFIENSKEHYIEKDGVLYVMGGGRGSVYFDLDTGVTLSDVTDNSFTATPNDISVIYGKGTFKFVLEDNEWLIESYDFLREDDGSESEESDDSKADTEVLKNNAISLMDSFNTIYSILGGSVGYDESKTFTENGVTYALVTDYEKFSSLDNLIFQVESSFCGTARENILSLVDTHFKQKEDGLYVATGARGPLEFITDEGVEISDYDETSFTATTIKASDMFGKGIAHIERYEDTWHIESYEFK